MSVIQEHNFYGKDFVQYRGEVLSNNRIFNAQKKQRK